MTISLGLASIGQVLFIKKDMLRIALQAKGRLNEKSVEMLQKAGVSIEDNNRKFLSKSSNYPVEMLYLRDDDIPQAVHMGVADLGIVGYNEVLEKGYDVKIVRKLGFGGCRISLAIPKNDSYEGLSYFEGKRIATSYPNILRNFLDENGLKNTSIHEIAGSVEIAPAVGMSDAIFDIVSSGGTLVRNGLKEVSVVVESEAVLIASPSLSEEALKELDKLEFRLQAVCDSRGMKYVLMNIPNENLDKAIDILPSMKSPTILPLAQDGWSSLHTVIDEDSLWEVIESLKAINAEGILVLSLEQMIR